MKKLFVILAALAALTMAGCAASGGEVITSPDDEQVVVPGSGAEDGENGSPDSPVVVPDVPVTPNEPTIPEEEPETEPEQQYKQYVTLTTSGVNIRGGAGTGYTSLGSADKDNGYLYLGEENGWYKVYYKNRVAYISKKYATVTSMPASDNEKVESVIYEGGKLLGTTYVYGATRYHDGKGNKLKGFTLSAFDCSSLMQYMFYMGADGHLLAVTTRTQVVQGKTVAKGDLQRGDLMFFTNAQRYNKTGVERIGHVALYLGDNLILHTASDYARIEQISSTRWKYFIQAQRMI